MSKRTATRELNHDNWDDDDEEEEAGTFQPASAEALNGRVIKQARRRLAGTEGEVKKNVFSGFAGFGARTTPASNAFNISFGAKTQPPAEKSNGESKTTSSDDSDANEKEYLASLKVLNETVTSWITEHVKKNPCCVLTPIFQDYEKHLKDLESKKNSPSTKENKNTDSVKASPSFTMAKTEKDDSKPSFGSATVDTPRPSLNFFSNDSTPAKPPAFSFGAMTSTPAAPTSSFSFKTTTDTEPKAPPSTFSFKGASSTSATSPPSSSSTPLFSFSATKPTTTPMTSFSFGLSKPPVTEEKKDTGDDKEDEGDDEDTPPKVEVKQVQEDDAFYSIKCKLFYKKDNSYTEKGVGMLHLKKVKDDKTQLVIRADTSLGNILLNILLNPQLTTQRVGKNNVMLVCVPNPPIDPKTPPVPTPMLLRVKTDVEADELLAALNDAKK